MKKTISLNEKELTFQTNGGLPRLYRLLTGGDIFQDIQKLTGENPLANGGMEILENLAFAMYHSANPQSNETIEEWLSQFGTFQLVEMLPDIIELWEEETETKSPPNDNQRKDSKGDEHSLVFAKVRRDWTFNVGSRILIGGNNH